MRAQGNKYVYVCVCVSGGRGGRGVRGEVGERKRGKWEQGMREVSEE